MKAVLVGTDFMYRQDGSLVPIEINTNIALDSLNRMEYIDDIWHFDGLRTYLKNNGIKVVFLEGRLWNWRDAFKAGLGEGFVCLRGDSATVPGTDEILIRNSFNETALIDAYCADKVKFMSLVKDQEYGLEYLVKVGETVEGQISTIPDNGNLPNFIVKYRYPSYNREVYPKFYKLGTIQEVEALASSLEDGYFVEPYLYNEDKILEERGTRVKLLRDWSVMVEEESTIKSISIADYTKITSSPIVSKDVLYNEDHSLKDECRPMFLINHTVSENDERLGGEDVIVESTDEVLMQDNTWKPASELVSGSIVKAVNVPVSGNVDIKDHVVDYNIPYSELESGSTFTTASIRTSWKYNGYIDKVRLDFTDGTDWFDTAESSYLTLDPEDGSVKFTEIQDLSVGNKVIYVTSASLSSKPEYVQKEVRAITKSREYVDGYSIAATKPHTLITKASGEPGEYFSIEHNANGTLPEDVNVQPCSVDSNCIHSKKSSTPTFTARSTTLDFQNMSDGSVDVLLVANNKYGKTTKERAGYSWSGIGAGSDPLNITYNVDENFTPNSWDLYFKVEEYTGQDFYYSVYVDGEEQFAGYDSAGSWVACISAPGFIEQLSLSTN